MIAWSFHFHCNNHQPPTHHHLSLYTPCHSTPTLPPTSPSTPRPPRPQPPTMVLEATMLIVDNSDPSRNGDYPPSRWTAQTDLATLLFNAKTQSNPESSVGLLSLASPTGTPELLSTLTTNPGNILDGLHRTVIGGKSDFLRGVMVAGLALKHRGNKGQRQRIIVCVCSEVGESKSGLVKLGKRMKKNGVSVDVVAFGDLTDDNLDKLRAFNEAVKGGEGSHLEVVPPGPNLLSDSIVASPILAGEGGGMGSGGAGGAEGASGGGAGGAGGDFEFGVDPNMDPELALVLRMSMEEERERQARETRAREEAEGKTALESVPEEGAKAEGEASETQPLLQESGESSKPEDKKDKDGDDKMDTQ